MKVALGIPYWGDEYYRSRNYDWLLPYMKALYPWDTVITGDLDYKGVSRNRGAYRNAIMEEAHDIGMDVVVLCDADTFPEREALFVAIETTFYQGGLNFAYDRFRALNEAGTNMLLKGHTLEAATQHLESECMGSLGGVMVIRPDNWFAAGCSPELDGWGFEDVIFAVQARTLLPADNRWHTGWITHLYHPSEVDMTSESYKRNIAVCKQYEAANGNPYEIRKLLRERF